MLFRKMLLGFLFILIFSFFFPVYFVFADDPKFIFKAKNWELYTGKDESGSFCFVTSTPIYKDGNYKKRSEPRLFVNHIIGETDEFGIQSGYPYSENSMVSVAVYYNDGDSMHDLIKDILKDARTGKCSTGSDLNIYLDFIADEMAWSRDIDIDKKAVGAMKKGYYLITTGRSKKGTCSVDIYSLIGFSSAYKRMIKECGE